MSSVNAWRLRQFAPVDADGRVVSGPAGKGTTDARITGWRVRWDTPTRNNRSRNFTKKRLGATTARQQAADLAAHIEAARLGGWHEAPDGSPRRGEPTAARATSELTFAQLAEAFLRSKRGKAPKTREYYETQVTFAVQRLPEQLLARDVTTDYCEQLLDQRRNHAGHKATKARRSGADMTEGRNHRCSRRTEKAFVQTLRAVFKYGMQRTPQVVTANPASTLAVRADDVADLSSDMTFTREQVFAIADAIGHGFAPLVLLRGTSAIRTGEAVKLTAADVDLDRWQLTVRASGGKVNSRHSESETRSYSAPLKHRPEGDERSVPIPGDPDLLAALARAKDLAVERFERRERLLVRRVTRWERQHDETKAMRARHELDRHRSQPPRLFTMPNGAELDVAKFVRDYWKPTLAGLFPDDVDDAALAAEHRKLRTLSFYSLRASAVTGWVLDAGVSEDTAAVWAGHSLETQISAYRKRRSADELTDRRRLDAAWGGSSRSQ